MKARKVLVKALASPANLRFADVQRLVEGFGFALLRTSGSHHIYGRPGMAEQVNLQEVIQSSESLPSSAVSSVGRTVQSPTERGGGGMSDYHINIFFSDEDGGYIADVPDLDACSAFGHTPAEALAELQVAKAAWLDANRANGHTPPEPRYRPAIYQSRAG